MGEGDGLDDADDPARAFEKLRGEVSLLRLAVEGLTAARENIEIPDYQPTLTKTQEILGVLAQQVAAMRKSPALSMMPKASAAVEASAGRVSVWPLISHV